MSRLSYSIPSFILFFSTMLWASEQTANTEPLKVKTHAPKTYTVVKGDTLWDISELYLDNPWLWPRLWQINPEIHNPHLIYPGDKLTLIWRDGQPVLSLKPMVKLSPKIRQFEKEAVTTLPKGLVIPYIKSDRLIDRALLEQSNRVLGTSEARKYLTKEDRLYISGTHTHEKWGIYRPVKEYERTDTEEVVVALRHVATASLDKAEDSISGLIVESQQQEILLNDVAIPDVELSALSLNTTFYPLPVAQNQMANILGSLDGSEYMATNQVVILDRGTQDDLRQGSMFNLIEEGVNVYGEEGDYHHEESVSSLATRLPQSVIGSLMVIRPYESFSLAIITHGVKPINIRHTAVSPLGGTQVSLDESAVEVSDHSDILTEAAREES